MFTFIEVFFIVVIISAIVGYISYCFAEFKIITRILNELSEEELTNLTKEIEEMSIIADVISDGDKTQSYSKTLIQEVVAGQTFLFEGSKFIAQGSSASEAAANFFNSKYSTTIATVKCSEGNSYKIVNGKIET